MKNIKRLIPAITLIALQCAAHAATINFDALDATGGGVSGAALASYLAQWGVTISGVTPGSQVLVLDDRQVYGGGILVSPSGHNTLAQSQNGPIHFTLNFSVPQSSVSFTRAGLGATFSSFTAWSAHAFNAASTEVSSVSEDEILAFNLPARSFKLTGPGITSVRWDADNCCDGFSSIVMDDLVLPQAKLAGQSCDPAFPGMVLWWDFANGTAADRSGYQNNGIVAGTPVFTNGTVFLNNPVGQVTSTHWIEVPYSASIRDLETNSFTLAVRYKSTDTGRQNGRLFGNYTNGMVYNAGNQTCAYSGLRNSIGQDVTIPSTITGPNPCLNTAQTTDGNYHWQILCVDRTQARATQYVDATHVASESIAGFGRVGLQKLLLGTDPVYHWFGARQTTVEDVCIFNRSLSPNEVAEISVSGDLGICGRPVLKVRPAVMEIEFNTISNGMYNVEATSNLAPNAWAPWINCLRATNTTMRVYDTIPPEAPQRFYRAVFTNCVPLP